MGVDFNLKTISLCWYLYVLTHGKTLSLKVLAIVVYLHTQSTGPCGSVVEHPLREREVVGSNPGRAIPKALKMVPVATLLGAQHYKASTGFSSPNKYRTTNFATLTKFRKKSDNNQCL